MADWDEIIAWLHLCDGHAIHTGHGCEKCPFLEGVESREECVEHLYAAAISLLKAQEQEISRLKYHVDCDAAEKIPSGCVGYGRGFNDDEPCETCKACEKYNLYGEE